MRIDDMRGMDVMFLFTDNDIETVYNHVPEQLQVIKKNGKTQPSENNQSRNDYPQRIVGLYQRIVQVTRQGGYAGVAKSRNGMENRIEQLF